MSNGGVVRVNRMGTKNVWRAAVAAFLLGAMLVSLSGCDPVTAGSKGKHHEWFNPQGKKVTDEKATRDTPECALGKEGLKERPVPPVNHSGEEFAGWSWSQIEISIRALQAGLPGQRASWQYCVPLSVQINATVDGQPMPLAEAPGGDIRILLERSNPATIGGMPFHGLRNTPISYVAVIGWDQNKRPPPTVKMDVHAKYEQILDENAEARAGTGEIIALFVVIKQNDVPFASSSSANVTAKQQSHPEVVGAGLGPYVRCNPPPFAATGA